MLLALAALTKGPYRARFWMQASRSFDDPGSRMTPDPDALHRNIGIMQELGLVSTVINVKMKKHANLSLLERRRIT